MKKIFKTEGLDCPNCAAKLERALSKIDGVNEVSVSFMSQKITMDLEESRLNDIVKEMLAVGKKVEPDCTIKA